MGNLAVIDNEYAAMVTQQSRTSFYYSFSLLPRDERQAMHSVYAFCRYADDIIDEDDVAEEGTPVAAPEQRIARKRERLNRLRAEVERCYNGESRHPITRSLSAAVKRFKIPKQYFLTLLDGVEMDLVKNRYETFEELREYCYGVASVVGLICIEIFGYKYEETKEYAVNLGIALQLTNILRDVKSDAERGRIYLPLEDLRAFGYSESDLLENRYTLPFIELMRFQTRRAREYYGRARAALRPDERRTMFAAEIMDAIYYRMLEKIELNEFDIYRRKISVRTPHKLWIAFKLWLVTRVLTNRKSAAT
ncbi:MAG: presqualene diphosphate synthase HpnD [Chlorobi bacterium]|nr:MAG: phytoene synthase [Chlorobi bacterium OLB7]MBK8911082.1 presqualene diphosphate synthase HpnD [Chlorobiota bacterium]MBX7216878.1 presqualene diphosphate synthase HpnD [Candidatus Kapabacteria bacterium]